jgi:hypothetical protein
MLTKETFRWDKQCSGCDQSRHYINTSQPTNSDHHKWKSKASLLHQLAHFRVCQPSCFLMVQYLYIINYKDSCSNVGTVICYQSHQVFTAFCSITGYQKESMWKLNYISCREWSLKRVLVESFTSQHAFIL